MEVVKDWSRALIYTGQSLKGEDIVKYTAQLREVDPNVLEYNIADAEWVSGLPIADYLVSPDEIFNNNATLQMVVHTLNVTASDLIRRKMVTTEGLVAAGHSLGEVAALDIAKVFPTRAASMEFVFARGSGMQRAYIQNPGSLYMLLGLSEVQAGTLPAELGTVPALINAPELTVVAADKGRLAVIEAEVKKIGAKRVQDLEIPPFHTNRMLQAQADLEAFSRQREFGTAIFPVVSNYDGEAGLDGYELIVKHITSVTNPVRWVDVIATIKHPGVTFYTMGPGNNPAALNTLNGVPKEQTKDLFQLLAG